MTRTMLHRLAPNDEGSVLLETALTLGILLVLVFGIIDMGRALYTESNLVSAAREGARYAAVDPTVQNADTMIKRIVRQHFSPFGGDTLKDPNITVQTVVVGGNISSIQVHVAYPFTWISPLPRLLGWSSTRNLNSQAEYRFEH
jgi:Flp pilus assembly protein TadG